METIKLGSKGEAVKLVQKMLNVSADGIFGPITEKAVKEFQTKHNLSPDGIVGPKTYAALGIKDSTNSKCIDSSVIYKPLPKHISSCTSRIPKYLAIHFTAGSSSKPGTAQNVYNVFMNRQASADFCVDDRDMVQFNPDIKKYYCWAVGDNKNPYSKGGSLYGKATNRNTVSIEICSTCTPATSTNIAHSNHSGWTFTDTTLNNAVKLAKMIMKEYNIPIQNVVRHYDISGKICPGIIGWNDEQMYEVNTGKKIKDNMNNSKAWLEFKKRLQ